MSNARGRNQRRHFANAAVHPGPDVELGLSFGQKGVAGWGDAAESSVPSLFIAKAAGGVGTGRPEGLPAHGEARDQ
jgi:hypothetical protein